MFSYHVVQKRIKYYDATLKETVTPLDNNGNKFELFYYDAFKLSKAEVFGLLEVKKEEELALIRNPPSSSHDSPDTARNFVSLQHQRWLEARGVTFDSKEKKLIINKYY